MCPLAHAWECEYSHMQTHQHTQHSINIKSEKKKETPHRRQIMARAMRRVRLSPTRGVTASQLPRPVVATPLPSFFLALICRRRAKFSLPLPPFVTCPPPPPPPPLLPLKFHSNSIGSASILRTMTDDAGDGMDVKTFVCVARLTAAAEDDCIRIRILLLPVAVAVTWPCPSLFHL